MDKLISINFRKFLLRLFALLGLVWGIAAQAWAQCATCKSAAATKDETGELVVGQGLNTGILYLLAMPFLIGGIIGYIWWRNKQNYEKQKQLS